MATDANFNYEAFAAPPDERKIYFAAFVAAGGGEIPLKDNLSDDEVERLRNAHVAGKAAVDAYQQAASAGSQRISMERHEAGDGSLLATLCLVDSYSAFAEGDCESGCRKLWEAVEFALSVAAEKRGWPCQTEGDHFDILKQLQAETGKYEDPDIVSGYLVACNYRDNAEYGFMEDYEIKSGLPVVHDFIAELLSWNCTPVLQFVMGVLNANLTIAHSAQSETGGE